MEKIAYTTLPPNQPSLNEWMKEFKCGIQRPNPNDRASDMMKQWQEGKDESIWKTIADKIKVASLA